MTDEYGNQQILPVRPNHGEVGNTGDRSSVLVKWQPRRNRWLPMLKVEAWPLFQMISDWQSKFFGAANEPSPNRDRAKTQVWEIEGEYVNPRKTLGIQISR